MENWQKHFTSLEDFDFMRITAEKKVNPPEFYNTKNKKTNIVFSELCNYEGYESINPNDVIIFGDWVVDKEGNLDCPKASYFIDSNRLKEKDWISHIMSKGWVDLNTFIPAYWTALMHKKIEKITIEIY